MNVGKSVRQFIASMPVETADDRELRTQVSKYLFSIKDELEWLSRPVVVSAPSSCTRCQGLEGRLTKAEDQIAQLTKEKETLSRLQDEGVETCDGLMRHLVRMSAHYLAGRLGIDGHNISPFLLDAEVRRYFNDDHYKARSLASFLEQHIETHLRAIEDFVSGENAEVLETWLDNRSRCCRCKRKCRDCILVAFGVFVTGTTMCKPCQNAMHSSLLHMFRLALVEEFHIEQPDLQAEIATLRNGSSTGEEAC